jgi:F-box protein 9
MTQMDVDILENELKNLTIKEINEHPTKSREQIAFELFELASAKEQVGQLNDASDYYWKAFKLDEKVDLKYRERYFENLKSEENKRIIEAKDRLKKVSVNDQVLKTKPLELNKSQLNKLLESYSTCEFIANDENKPILISKLPYEVILNIIEILIMHDTPSWIDFSLVCKKLAYIGIRDKNIWSLLSRLTYDRQNYEDNDEEKFKMLIKNQWGINYYKMLNERPFLKYRGVYISKVSYMKEGARSENSNSWNLPYRIISYYRYYRFFNDATCLKIITILEPKKVIPKLHKGYKVNEDEELINENLQTEAQLCLQGNKSPVDNFSNRSWLRIFKGTYKVSLQGDVETNCDGSVEKYRFIDKFKITSTGKYHRHNKLEWVDLGFYDTINRTYCSLNRTNEKDFVFSRVKSYSY